ncbi:Hypothetical protein, putative [Bodo saltans]|uniref:RING-type domain-containing protein n=1 Tax=Bodo saltans TaxID=75058 RepID=A0A0S4IRC7_BODSA|nr:Hypothetical protein, putative [Bodo saltans]|eukprot:CUG01551.1 Hypothetical protein, putative [Bodo saltans]
MNCLLCAECHGGGTSEHHLCVTVPCGHFLHEHCFAYLKKLSKLLHSEQQIRPHEPLHSSAPHCPECNKVVLYNVKIFVDTPATAVDLQSRVAHLQRKLLMRMAETSHNKREVISAQASCASRYQEINGLRGSLETLQATLASLDQMQPQGPKPTALHDENAAIAKMTQRELAWLVRDLHMRMTSEKTKLDAAQKLLTTKKNRYASLKSQYDAQRVTTAKARSARRAATIHLDPVVERPVAAPAAAASREAVVAPIDVVDVDAEDSDDDSDVEVVAVVPRARVLQASNDAFCPMRPVPGRVLPSYDVGSGRSLMDFPRAADATFQGLITQYQRRT